MMLKPVDCLENSLQTNSVCAVWITQVASGVDLVWLDLLNQIGYDADVFFTKRLLFTLPVS